MPSTRSLWGIVKTSSVGRLAVKRMPLPLVDWPLTQTCRSGSPIVRLVPGPRVDERRVAPGIEAILARVERGEVRAPRRHGIRMIEPAERGNGVPEPRQRDVGRRLGKHFAGPRRRCRRDDRPVGGVLRNEIPERPERASGCQLHHGDLLGVAAPQQIGIVRVDHQHRVSRPHVVEERRPQPAGRRLERIARRVAEPHELQRLVTPDRLDVAGSGAIRGLRQASNQRGRVERDAAIGERSDDRQPLPRLQVQPDPNRQVGVLAEGVVDIAHVLTLSQPRRPAHGSGSDRVPTRDLK